MSQSTMSGPLKLANPTALYASKSYQYPNVFSPSAAVKIKPVIRQRSAAWICRAILGASYAHREIASSYFSIQKSDRNVFDCINEGRRGDCGLHAEMPATVNGSVDNQYDDSDVSPSQKNRERKPESPSKLLTLPTILTIGRVAAVPLLVYAFYVESLWGPTATTIIFIAASVTDWLDGYLARKMNLGTPFGAFLDPVADKLMVAATLILLCTKPFEAGIFGQASWILTLPAISIIGREITMSAVREWAASQDGKLLEAVAVNNLGKWKTATQMSALTILLAVRDNSLMGAATLVYAGVVLLYISAWLAVWSLAVYMKKIWKVLLR